MKKDPLPTLKPREVIFATLEQGLSDQWPPTKYRASKGHVRAWITWDLFRFNTTSWLASSECQTTCSYDKKTVRETNVSTCRMMHVSSFSERPAKVFTAALFPIKRCVRPLSHVVSCSTRNQEWPARCSAGISVSHGVLYVPPLTGSTRNVVKSPIDLWESLYPGFCFFSRLLKLHFVWSTQDFYSKHNGALEF